MREGVGLGVGVGVAGENEPAGAEGGTMRGVARLMRGEETTAGIAVGSPDSSMPGAASRFWDGPKAAGVVRGGELGLSGEGVPRGEEPVELIGEGGWGLMGEGALGVTGEGELGFMGEALLRLTGELEVSLLPKALEAVLTLAVGIAAVMLGLAALIGTVPELPPGDAVPTRDPMLGLLPAWLLLALTADPVWAGTADVLTALLLEKGAFAIGFAMLGEAKGARVPLFDAEGTAGLLWAGSGVPKAADGVEMGVLCGSGETPCALVAEEAADATVGAVAGGEARVEEEGSDDGGNGKEGEDSEAGEEGEAGGEEDTAGGEEDEAGGEEDEAAGEEAEAGGEEDEAGGEEDAVGGEEDEAGAKASEPSAEDGDDAEVDAEEGELAGEMVEPASKKVTTGEIPLAVDSEPPVGLASEADVAGALPAVGEGVKTEGVADVVLLEGVCWAAAAAEVV